MPLRPFLLDLREHFLCERPLRFLRFGGSSFHAEGQPVINERRPDGHRYY